MGRRDGNPKAVLILHSFAPIPLPQIPLPKNSAECHSPPAADKHHALPTPAPSRALDACSVAPNRPRAFTTARPPRTPCTTGRWRHDIPSPSFLRPNRPRHPRAPHPVRILTPC